MIYLLYGPDTVSSRAFLVNLAKDYPDRITIDASRQTGSKLILPKESSLFREKRLIVLENLTPNENEPVEKVSNLDVVIWTKEVVKPPTWIDKSWNFKQTDFLSGFRLSDLVVAGQKKSALLTLKKLLEQKTPSELIIGSLVRQMKLISFVLKSESDQISKSSFVIEKTKLQAKNWTIKKIKKSLLLILKTDWEIKSGIVNPESGLTILIDQICDLGKIS
jgi:DNA polymerase III delta subunit